VATFAIDTDHVVTHWNSACEQLLGFTAAEMVGTREHWKAFYPQPRACLADLLVATISRSVKMTFTLAS